MLRRIGRKQEKALFSGMIEKHQKRGEDAQRFEMQLAGGFGHGDGFLP